MGDDTTNDFEKELQAIKEDLLNIVTRIDVLMIKAREIID